jgi:hypothetical protein
MRGSGGRYGRTTAAERAQLLERFRESGLTGEEFSQREGMAESTLKRWIREARRNGAGKSLIRGGRSVLRPKGKPGVGALRGGPALREVELSSWLVPPWDWAVELVNAAGLRIRLRDRLQVQDLSVLLRD